MSATNLLKNELTIDLLGLADTEALAGLALRAYQDHYLHLWLDGGEWYMNRCFNTGQLAAELADPNSRFYFIRDAGQPVGFLKINLDKTLPTAPDLSALELERIYFLASATGKGLGRFAVDFVVRLAQELNKACVWLKAMDSSEAALHFYRQNGFTVVGAERLTFAVMKPELRGMLVLSRPILSNN
ncbi:GNAT family N-acetyltransferase [Arsenicibacter rosenii]|uniref:N-acetyltransferase domain-containing protein n=1 Tax=Arsenicibacter rosenii TaxID=1750698 RepID=A0A1S2VR47_9BACT|nr:GNAT family N-acetyltransferase [Arsenicibacter rosenii]OIN61242.1 hypothetical protein BLX24_00530 [Arsenicibacter rosenii]